MTAHTTTPQPERFPVGSWLLGRRDRAVILAYYQVARQVDDWVDDGARPVTLRRAGVAACLAALMGQKSAPLSGEITPQDQQRMTALCAAAQRVRAEMIARGLDLGCVCDLVQGLAQDLDPPTIRTWDDLAASCRASAEPVGQFLLHLHGEDPDQPAVRALCRALQVLNHLSDIGLDLARLGRCYLPQDIRDAVGESRLGAVIAPLLLRVEDDLARAWRGRGRLRSWRLRLEMRLTCAYALAHLAAIRRGDILTQRVTPSGWGIVCGWFGGGIIRRRAAAQLAASGTDWAALVRRCGSSFYHAMRWLGEPHRSGILILYAFCRAADDIVDDAAGQTRAQVQQTLTAWQTGIRDPACPPSGQAALFADLHRVIAYFALNPADVMAVLDGMAMDASGQMYAPSLAVLDLYCERVASAVGRLILGCLGEASRPAELAHHLGRALQWTNIRRDVEEDARLGRLYLPREWLIEAGFTATSCQDPLAVIHDPRCAPLLLRLEQGAAAAFATVAPLLAGQGRLWPVAVMMASYLPILRRHGRRPSTMCRVMETLSGTVRLLRGHFSVS